MKTIKNTRVIIFDFDGVIADSLPLAFEVNKLSKPTLTLERYRRAFNKNINDVTYEDAVVREVDFVKEYRNRFAVLGIDSDKKRIIRKLAQECQLFIISSTIGDIIREYLKRHRLLDCFTDILGNDVHPSKVKKFHMVFHRYNIKVENCIFLTDSFGDIREAQKVGVPIIVGILGGYQNEKSLQKANPTMIVNTFTQFYRFVHSHFQYEIS